MSSNIPEIAITYDSNEESQSNESGNIAEALTDVEDLNEEAQASRKPKKITKKSKLKIKLNNDDDQGAVTDLEDIEASDNEDYEVLVEHSNPLDLSNIEIDTFTSEEYSKGEGKEALSNKEHEMGLLKPENIDDGLTDVEDYDTDEDSDESDHIPDNNVNLDDYRPDYVDISSGTKEEFELETAEQTESKSSGTLAVPNVSSNQLTDIENVDSDEENCERKTRCRRRRSKIAGCSKKSSGCNSKTEGCSKKSESCSKKSDGCRKKSEGCSKKSEGCTKKPKSCCKKSSGCEKFPITADRMKKSFSLPAPQRRNSVLSDSDDEEKNRLGFALCRKVSRGGYRELEGLTDTEEIEGDPSEILSRHIPVYNKSVEDKMNQSVYTGVTEQERLVEAKPRTVSNLKSPVDSKVVSDFFTNQLVADSTDDELVEGEVDESATPEIVLPPPIRTLIVLHEDKALVPTTKILPLSEDHPKNLYVEHDDDCLTDTEDFKDNVSEGNRLYLPKTTVDPDTDVEDLDAVGTVPHGSFVITPKHFHITFPVDDLTDTEDFYLTDQPPNQQIVVQRQESSDENHTDVESFATDDENMAHDNPGSRATTPLFINDLEGDIVSTRDHHGNSTVKNRLGVERNSNRMRSRSATPNLTDSEDVMASADDESYSRAKTVTPSELNSHLEQTTFSKVHVESSKKINYDAPTEVMYLKGGSYRQTHTDVEDISDDDQMWENMGEIGVRLNIKNESVCFGFLKEWDVSKKSPSPKETSPIAKDAEQQGEEAGTSSAPQDPSSTIRAEGEEAATGAQPQTQRPVSDQHQLSDEMRQLLKDLERESKQ